MKQRIGRRSGLSVAVACSALVAGVLTAPPAAADTFPISSDVELTSTVKKIKQTTVFPKGTFEGTVDSDTATITGALTVPDGVSEVKLGKLSLAKITIRVIPRGQSVGDIDVDGTVWNVTSTAEIDLQIVAIRPFNSKTINLVSDTCRTVSPITQVLRGTIDFSKTGPGGPDDYRLEGTYTIPRFANCGILTPLLNGLIPGPGNTAQAHFTR